MWLKIDESALDDWRIALLGRRMSGSYADALLVCMRVWRRLYNRGGGVMAPEEIDAVANRDGVAMLLVECSLADATQDGIRIRGEDRAKEFSYYRASQSKKGQKRQSGKRDDNCPTGAEPGLSRGLAGAEPVISLSESDSSGSGSSSGCTDGPLQLVLTNPVGVPCPMRQEAERLWALQDRLRLETCPGVRSLRPTEERLDRVLERLAENSAEDCEHVLRVIADECRIRPESRKWFNGITNWRPESFDRALGGSAASSSQSDRAPDRAWLSNLGGTKRNK